MPRKDREAQLAYQREWYQRNRESQLVAMRSNNLRSRYGITDAEYDALLEQQSGVCAICNAATGWRGKRLAVDHCHATGKVRGLLCDRCNMTIGKIADPELLRRAADYLDSS